MDNLHLIIQSQFPEFVRSDYPVFVEFIKTYYKWIEQEQSVGNIQDAVDIDATDQFVQYFKKQLDCLGLLNNVDSANKKTYYKRIKQIYDSKGSEQSLVTLLRMVCKSDVSVRYPGENVLMASAATWRQENFITVQSSNPVPTVFSEFYVQYTYGTTRVPVTRYKVVGSDTVRLYYNSNTSLFLTENQVIQIKANNIVVYVGRVKRGLANVGVIKKGESWQVGQIVIMKDTIARVAEIDNNGGINRVDIIKYGTNHVEGEMVMVSPYPNKPTGTNYDLVTTHPTETSFRYELTLNDYTDGTTDHVIGMDSGSDASSYFLEDYVEIMYSGAVRFDNLTTPVYNPPAVTSGITLEQWLASRAILLLEYGTVSKLPGRWDDESHQLSNQNTCLQDNLYYQQFSYEIKSNTNSSVYLETARAVHPAGMKLFTVYDTSDDIVITPVAEISFSS